MRVCVLTATNRLLEAQSDATEGTLLANAIGAGHAAKDVEEREVTPAEFSALVAALPKPSRPADPVVAAIDKALASQTTPDILTVLAALKAERQR